MAYWTAAHLFAVDVPRHCGRRVGRGGRAPGGNEPADRVAAVDALHSRVVLAEGGDGDVCRVENDPESRSVCADLASVCPAAVGRRQARQVHRAVVSIAVASRVEVPLDRWRNEVNPRDVECQEVRVVVRGVSEELLVVFVPFDGVELFFAHVVAAPER